MTNISVNCLDRWVEAGRGNTPCFLYEGNEPGPTRTMTYAEVLAETCRVVSGCWWWSWLAALMCCVESCVCMHAALFCVFGNWRCLSCPQCAMSTWVEGLTTLTLVPYPHFLSLPAGQLAQGPGREAW